jgi:hypothetical protein
MILLMDLSFFRRTDQRSAGRLDAALDYGLLVEMLRAHQQATLATCAEIRFDAAMQDPLVELLLGGEEWRHAVVAQKGCFNPAYARQETVN